MVRAHGLTGVPVRVDYGQHGHQIPSWRLPGEQRNRQLSAADLCREFRPGGGVVVIPASCVLSRRSRGQRTVGLVGPICGRGPGPGSDSMGATWVTFKAWVGWCTEPRVHPCTARRHHVDSGVKHHP
jgi:hypothetical protein